MSNKRILIIQGHPDTGQPHYCHALAQAYEQGAKQAGHDVEHIDVASLGLGFITSAEQWRSMELPAAVVAAQAAIRRVDHLVLVYPLWLGTMPALVKGFFEQVMRPGFALDDSDPNRLPQKLLTGKSARIVVTMGMPAFVYRWFFFAHGLKNLERNILRMCGVAPIRASLIGGVEGSAERRGRWLAQLHRLGVSGS